MDRERGRRLAVIDVQDAAVLGFGGLRAGDACNGQSGRSERGELRNHEILPECRAVDRLGRRAYRCLATTLAGVFCPINRTEGPICNAAKPELCRQLANAAAWPHHGRSECDGLEPGSVTGESDHIVAEVAARIFADLADPQTINRAKDGAKDGTWKAPLWRALTEAGLPLAWVPDNLGGSGASLADGFAVLGAAGRFALAVPLAETLIAGWLLARAGLQAPRRRHDGRPCPAARPHHARQRWHAQRPRARRSVCRGYAAHRRAGRRHRRAGRDQRLPD